MLHIKKPYIEEKESETRLVCFVEEDGKEREIWYSVDKEYGRYLCYEVADAFLIGLLSYAIRGNHDIVSDAPISEILLYNITQNYLPVLTKKGSVNTPKIMADTIEPEFEKTGFVGTGLSCGVDSFHSIFRMLNSKYKTLNLTHFCINNVGAFNDTYSRADGGKQQVKIDCYKRSEKVADELGIPILMTNSNFAEAFPQNHFLTHTFSSIFAVFCMQKMWDRYYYSSGTHDISYFDLKDFINQPCARYDLLSLSAFSTNKLRLFSEGSNCSRLEKIVEIADFKPAQENLHVCTSKSTNCGVCPKCVTTEAVLDAAGTLVKFNKVFDVDTYYCNRDTYLTYILQQHMLSQERREGNYDDEMFDYIRKSVIKKMACNNFDALSEVEKIILFK